LQGIETLPLRMARHVSNTQKVVEFLASHAMVSRVGHPMPGVIPAMHWQSSCYPAALGSVFGFDVGVHANKEKPSLKRCKFSVTWPTSAIAGLW